MSITEKPFFITYRAAGATASEFIEVNALLRSENVKRISDAYAYFCHNVQNYITPETSIDKIVALEQRFYAKLITSQVKLEQALQTNLWSRSSEQVQLAKMQKVHTQFEGALERYKRSLEPKKLQESPQELTELRQRRIQDNPSKELSRLKKQERIKNSLGRTWLLGNTARKIAYGRSLELREALKEKYYIVNHGQNGNLMLINMLAKKLKQMYEPDQYENYEVLRHDAHLKHVTEEQTVEWFRKKLSNDVIDHSYRRELISGDCYLESTASFESALFFFNGNTNVAADNHFLKTVVDPIIQEYFPDESTRQLFIEEIDRLSRKLKNEDTLYSICIPKEEFGSMGYFSRSFGRPFPNPVDALEMQKLQDGKLTFFQRLLQKAPQVRLLTHKLDPQRGVMIFPHSTVSETTLDSISQEMDLLIKRAKLQFRI